MGKTKVIHAQATTQVEKPTEADYGTTKDGITVVTVIYCYRNYVVITAAVFRGMVITTP